MQVKREYRGAQRLANRARSQTFSMASLHEFTSNTRHDLVKIYLREGENKNIAKMNENKTFSREKRELFLLLS